MNVPLFVGSICVFIAAVIHVFIFFMESIAWSQPATWKRFGIKNQAEADAIKPMAFNQGFYNLFLALGVGLGLILMSQNIAGGIAITLFAAGCMVAAALVLVLSSPKLGGAAALQGVSPLIGVVLLSIGLATA